VEVHGFPAALTSFIGREEAVRDVARLLEERRLVTVTGPGGMGKTRLAGQVARRVAARFDDGAWPAELAPVRDPAQVAAVVAAALGIPDQPGKPLADTLAQALAGQHLLLVLDNCEHMLDAAAQLCAGLLAACDDVRVLATSREPLAAAGEARYRLAPLTLPAADDTADSGRSESVAQELVTLVAQGRTNAQIAAELHISVRTVGSHLDRIRDKTGCRRRTDLTRLALSASLV
jgi:predicted ATPase